MNDLLNQEIQEVFSSCDSKNPAEELKNRSRHELTGFLCQATRTEKLHLFNYLLELGADPIGNVSQGFTPVHCAAQEGNIAFLKDS